MAKITEGMMPYLGYETYYRIVGEKNPKKAPLLLLVVIFLLVEGLDSMLMADD